MPLQASSIWTLILQYCLSQKHAKSKTDWKILVAPPQSTAHDKMHHPIPTHHPLLSSLHTWQELVCQFGDSRENREEKLGKLYLLPWGSHAPLCKWVQWNSSVDTEGGEDMQDSPCNTLPTRQPRGFWYWPQTEELTESNKRLLLHWNWKIAGL